MVAERRAVSPAAGERALFAVDGPGEAILDAR
jgi:hypothetical protein